MIKAVKLDYDYNIFTSADYSVHSGSCISHQVHELKDIHDGLEAFPETMTRGKTLIGRYCGQENKLTLENLASKLVMKVLT